ASCTKVHTRSDPTRVPSADHLADCERGRDDQTAHPPRARSPPSPTARPSTSACPPARDKGRSGSKAKASARAHRQNRRAKQRFVRRRKRPHHNAAGKHDLQKRLLPPLAS